MCSENIDVTLEKLEEVGKVLFEWFSNNFLKANADKCHLILSTDEPFSINIDNEVIKNSSNKKLLGINLNNSLGCGSSFCNVGDCMSQITMELGYTREIYLKILKRKILQNSAFQSY